MHERDGCSAQLPTQLRVSTSSSQDVGRPGPAGPPILLTLWNWQQKLEGEKEQKTKFPRGPGCGTGSPSGSH